MKGDSGLSLSLATNDLFNKVYENWSKLALVLRPEYPKVSENGLDEQGVLEVEESTNVDNSQVEHKICIGGSPSDESDRGLSEMIGAFATFDPNIAEFH